MFRGNPHESSPVYLNVHHMMYHHRVCLLTLLITPSVFAAEAPIQAPGVPNFHQVNEHVFRGAQPVRQGWESLAALGVKVVIDLRREHEDGEHSTAAEAKAVHAAGMRYVNVPMNGIMAPGDADIAKVLGLLNGAEPVFVHCKKGMDRTGTVVACYRISHDQWKNKKAMDEARSIGLHWVELGMKRYITGFRSVAGTPAPAETQVMAVAANQN
jgi:tyrosine-protein phosphatase SIW14